MDRNGTVRISRLAAFSELTEKYCQYDTYTVLYGAWETT